jgi:hypothetical protein
VLGWVTTPGAAGDVRLNLLTSPVRHRLVAVAALLALVHAAAIPLIDADRAAWRHDHGHLGSGALTAHTHPWEAGHEAEGGTTVFTFGDVAAGVDRAIDVPIALEPPALAGTAREAPAASTHAPPEAALEQRTPPPRA